MHYRCLLIWICLLMGAAQGLLAQDGVSEFPLRHKRVAVYFSKKHFTFDDNYRIPLSQFIKSDEGDAAEIENIKLQTLVALGTLFSAQLKQPSAADSVYFLNEFPDLASVFQDHYSSDEHTMTPLGARFSGTDYVMVLSPFILGSYKTSSVYTKSNRIITEQVVVKTARVRIELFDPATGQRMHVYESCIDERKTPVPNICFEFHMQFSRTGQFLAKLFSLAVQNMNAGIGSSCESN